MIATTIAAAISNSGSLRRILGTIRPTTRPATISASQTDRTMPTTEPTKPKKMPSMPTMRHAREELVRTSRPLRKIARAQTSPSGSGNRYGPPARMSVLGFRFSMM